MIKWTDCVARCNCDKVAQIDKLDVARSNCTILAPDAIACKSRKRYNPSRFAAEGIEQICVTVFQSLYPETHEEIHVDVLAKRVRERLNWLKKNVYRDVDAMREQLEKRGMKVDRTTLYRWLGYQKKSNEEELTELTSRSKAYYALQILETGRQGELTLDVAEPLTILALPSTIASIEREQRKLKKTDRVKRPLKITRHPMDTGGQTLKALTEGRVDIAIAATILVHQESTKARVKGNPDCCSRLCTLSRAPIVTIAFTDENNEFSRLDDLNGRVIGYPEGSSMSHYLENLQEKNPKLHFKHQPIEDSPNDPDSSIKVAADSLRNGDTDVFVAWDEYISQVEDKLRPKNKPTKTRGRRSSAKKLNRVLERQIGILSQDIAVNLTRVNPSAVFAYLRSLLEIIEDLRDKMRERIGDEVLAEWFGLPKFDRFELKDAIFDLQDFELDTLLNLRDRELSNLCPSTGHPVQPM